MSQPPIRTTFVQIPNGNLEINAYLAEPAGTGPFPGVIVFQEIFGVNAHIREVTERLAREDYLAIAPNIYQRLTPHLELGYSPEEIQLGRQYKNQTQAAELISDTQATLAYLRHQPQVLGQSLGCIGFCFGGHVAYLAATVPEIKATASFYGAGIATMTPGGGAPTLSRTPEIQGTLYAFFGTEDASIPAQEVDGIEAALAEAGVPHRVFRYPEADHGFFCDRRDSYNAKAAAEAWVEVKQLFQTVLRAGATS